MNRVDIQELRVHAMYPAVTIIARCDPQELRQKWRACLQTIGNHPFAQRLEDEFESLLERLACPLKDYMIGLFINKHMARMYVLPYPLEPVAVVDQVFALQEIVHTLNRAHRSWVLDFNLEYPRLYEGHGALLLPVERTRVQLSTDGKRFDEYSELPAVCGIGDRLGLACRYPDAQELIQRLDPYIARYLEQDALPLMVIASAEHEELFKTYSKQAKRVASFVRSQEDVWAAVTAWYAHTIEKAFNEVAHHEEGRLILSGITEIAHAAREGRIATLMVEHDHHVQGCEDVVTRALSPNTTSCPRHAIAIDVVDELIESVRGKGGTIIIVPNGTLATYGCMVAFLRYAE